MKIKKIISLILAVLCALMLFSACVWDLLPSEIPKADATTPTPTIDIPITDCPYSFLNSSVIHEGEDTEYEFIPDVCETDPKRIFYNAGTSTLLEGKKIVALFFVNDGASTWNEADSKSFINRAVLPALDFTEHQADIWGVELDFEVWSFSTFFDYDGIVNPNLNIGGSTKDVMIQVAESLGYSGDMALRWALLQRAGGTDVVPIFIVNKSGTSYARSGYIVGTARICEHAVIFNRKGILSSLDVTFAHELCHIFGAEELYKPESRYNLALPLYPYDIMCMESHNLKNLKIDDYTAYALGWTDTAPSICENDAWYRDYEYYKLYRESLEKE